MKVVRIAEQERYDQAVLQHERALELHAQQAEEYAQQEQQAADAKREQSSRIKKVLEKFGLNKSEAPQVPDLVLVAPAAPEFDLDSPPTYTVSEVTDEEPVTVETPHGPALALPGSYVLVSDDTHQAVIVQPDDFERGYQPV